MQQSSKTLSLSPSIMLAMVISALLGVVRELLRPEYPFLADGVQFFAGVICGAALAVAFKLTGGPRA